MSAPLSALLTAIASNTLNAAQQAALTTALTAIIPTFPTPDEIANGIQGLGEEDLAREWIAALYTIQAVGAGGGGPVPPSNPVFSVANAAAATALDATTFPAGTLIYVKTFGRYFSYQPADAGPVPGVRIAATPVGIWESTVTGIADDAARQTTWFVDGTGASGGNDENTGLTALTPIRTKAEIKRRWGGWNPDLTNVQVTITYLSADLADNDPGYFEPNFSQGATLTHTAALPATFTGTLLVVSAKNVAGNLGLRSTFTPVTGAIASGMVLVNATRGNSRAVAVTNLGGGQWLLSQPLAPYASGTIPTPTEVDTWAAGDTITGSTLLPIDLARIGGTCGSFNAAFTPSHIVQNLNVIDSNPADSGAGTCELVLGANLFAVDTVFTRNATMARGFTAVVISSFQGCDFSGQVNMSIDAAQSVNFAGGVTRVGGTLRAANLGTDMIINGGQILQDCQIGTGKSVLVPAGSTVLVRGATVAAGTGTMYGSGTLNARGSYSYGGAAATVLPIAALQLNGVATGYSNATAAGLTTTHGGIALSAANLDAAAGAAGFGGYAIGGGGTFSRQGLQP